MKLRQRRCQHCAQPLPIRARTDARFCSATCRSAHWQRRTRTNRALASRTKCAVCGNRIVFGTRADARYCSINCRQRIYRQRKRMAPPKAHQRTMRERLTATGTQCTADIRTATVREISRAEATPIVETYEWLGTMPAVTRHCYGILFAGTLGGVVVYGDEAGENLGVWDKYGFTGKIIALARGACLPLGASACSQRTDPPLHGSPTRAYAVVTATVYAGAGEVGTIYQACGFVYVGTMRQGGRALVRVNGKHM